MENISKAILSVMKEVKGMEKNSRVGAGTRSAYDGTKDQDVKEVFNKVMQENGLCILPINIEEETRIDRWEQTYNGNTQQKQSVFTKVKTKYMLLHSSGESITLSGYGHGVDSQDKGAGKATTYALKNCLLYTFLTPVGKIDDTDTTHSDQIETPTQPKREIKTWLSEDQFNAAMKSDKKGITKTISVYTSGDKGMKKDYLTKLTEQLKKLS